MRDLLEDLGIPRDDHDIVAKRLHKLAAHDYHFPPDYSDPDVVLAVEVWQADAEFQPQTDEPEAAAPEDSDGETESVDTVLESDKGGDNASDSSRPGECFAVVDKGFPAPPPATIVHWVTARLGLDFAEATEKEGLNDEPHSMTIDLLHSEVRHRLTFL